MDQALSLDHLAALTQDLERDIPRIRGSFPDFRQLGGQILATGGKRSTYVLGTIKSGKSTFLSALIAADILPRGSGVKTFNIFRVFHADVRAARVHFKSPAQLAAMLAFDFRMLGVDVQVPENPFDRAAGPKIKAIFEAFEKAAGEDGRLDAIRGRDEGQGFLALSHARVRQTIKCLEAIYREFDAETVLALERRHELYFEGLAFENYLRWAASPEFAVIIQEIVVGIPFLPRLPDGMALVDCQGSDSLNPLDFAAVDAALHRADQIFYVVNSRLGLRIADRDLLGHVQKAGLGDKAALILNVEAYEPLTQAELDKLAAKAQADLAGLGLPNIRVIIVNALLELFRSTRPDELTTMRGMWEGRGNGAVLRGVEANFTDLLRDLADAVTNDGFASTARVVPLLVQRAQTTAKALLARDRQVFGVQSSELGEKEVRLALRRILDGERTELHKRLTKKTFDQFDKFGPIQAELQAFIKAGVAAIAKSHPLPESQRAATRHGAVMAGAIEAFNTEWTLFDNAVRLKLVNPFIEDGFVTILASMASMYKLIPGVIAPKLAEDSVHALPEHAHVMAGLRERLARLALSETVPEVLRPIVLLPVIESGLAGEFYAKRLYEVVKAKITRKVAPAEANLGKVTKLWERTLTQAFKAAASDSEFSVSSAKENFRFQYFGKIAEALFARFEEVVMASVSLHFDEMKRLADASKLLLSAPDRQRIEAYLKAL